MDRPRPISGKGEKLALIGAVLQVTSVLGVFIALGWQLHALGSLNDHGPTSLDALASVLGASSLAFAIFGVLFLASLICLCIALAVFRCRAPWFFWFLAIYSWLLLLSFPIGTAAALFFLIYSLPRRSEFLSGQTPIAA